MGGEAALPQGIPTGNLKRRRRRRLPSQKKTPFPALLTRSSFGDEEEEEEVEMKDGNFHFPCHGSSTGTMPEPERARSQQSRRKKWRERNLCPRAEKRPNLPLSSVTQRWSGQGSSRTTPGRRESHRDPSDHRWVTVGSRLGHRWVGVGHHRASMVKPHPEWGLRDGHEQHPNPPKNPWKGNRGPPGASCPPPPLRTNPKLFGHTFPSFPAAPTHLVLFPPRKQTPLSPERALGGVGRVGIGILG